MKKKPIKNTKKASSRAVHGSALDSRLMHALKTDGAIRLFDGRWSLGFVDETALKDAIASGQLRTQQRHGMTFAVFPKVRVSDGGGRKKTMKNTQDNNAERPNLMSAQTTTPRTDEFENTTVENRADELEKLYAFARNLERELDAKQNEIEARLTSQRRSLCAESDELLLWIKNLRERIIEAHTELENRLATLREIEAIARSGVNAEEGLKRIETLSLLALVERSK